MADPFPTRQRSHLRPGGPLPRLHPLRSTSSFEDGMSVFSPIVEVQPITPGLDDLDPSRSSSRRYQDVGIDHPINDWKPKQDPCSKSEDSSITPPEAWGGEKISDKYAQMRTLPSRLQSILPSGVPDMVAASNQTSLSSSSTNSSCSYANLRARDISLKQDSSEKFSVPVPLSDPTASLTRRVSSYAERISATSALSDLGGSPKLKKTGSEHRELFNNLLSKSDIEKGGLPSINGVISQQPNETQQQGNSFSLQLFQRALEETLHSVKKSVCDDIRNLHIEILKQFHLQEMENAKVQNLMLENLDDLRNEVEALKEENQQLRQLL